MRTSKAFAAFTICVLSALTIPDAVNPGKVEAQTVTNYPDEAPNYRDADCSSFVTGTYLGTISTDGNVAPRSITTLTQHGNIFVVESSQSGIPGVINPFGDAQGAWKCTPNREITATTLNFSYPGAQGPGFLARTDYSATFDPQTQMVQGTVKVRFFDLNANQLTDDAPVVGTFDFVGQRVTAD